jgi:hypothetical protein
MSSYFYYDKYKTKDECLEAALRCCDSSCSFEIQYIVPGVNDKGDKDGAYKGMAYRLLYVTFRHGIPKIETTDTRIKYNSVANKMYLDTGSGCNIGSYWKTYQEATNKIAAELLQRGFREQGWYKGKYYLTKDDPQKKITIQATIEYVKSKYRCILNAASPKYTSAIGYEDIPYNPESEVSIKRFGKKVDEFLSNLNVTTGRIHTPMNEYGIDTDLLVFDSYISIQQLIKRVKVFTDNYRLDSGKVLFRDIPFLEEEQLCQHLKQYYTYVTTSDTTLGSTSYNTVEFSK